MIQAIKQKCVMIIAGEASGDHHGANLVKAMRMKDPTLFFCGIGGDGLEGQGVKLFFNIADLSVMGITEVVAKLPVIRQAMGAAKALLKNLKPDLLILIDFAEFNLRVAAAAKKHDIPVLYYIPPKVWAWRTGRVNTIKERVDQLAVILPFEAEFFRRHGLSATYTGNPLMDDDPQVMNQPDPGERPVIGLLPGSRKKEITRLLPVLMDAARLIKERITDARFMISLAPSVDRTLFEGILNAHPAKGLFEIVDSGVGKIFAHASFLVAASGTVTLQAALAGIPMVIVYKASALSHWIARRFVKIKYGGLANLIAGEEIVPELIQQDASPGNIAATVCDLMADPGKLEKMRQNLLGVREKLGGPGASMRVADMAMTMLHGDRAGQKLIESDLKEA
jgi:lipid-A-disaccharide synthase